MTSSALESGYLLAGTYRIEEPLGVGGMGVVYRAEHVRLGRKVAVKLLRGELTQAAVERFLLEARAMARIAHRAVIEVFDVGEVQAPFLAMELLRGETLAQRLARSAPMPVHELAAIATELCEGLAAAHAAGVVHRDLKPANVFLAEEPGGMQPKILDFGIAQVEGEGRLTSPGRILGTVLYLSPEQARAERELDGRSDLYSLGVLLFEASTGRHPFEGDSYAATLLRQASEEAPPLERFAPHAPAALCALVRSLLERNVEARPANAMVVARALAALRTDSASPAPAAPKAAPLDVHGNADTMTREAHALPPETTSLVGRVEELQQLERAWQEGARWLTLTGPVGVGKSRLALRFAHALSASVGAGGVLFVNVSSAEDEGQLASLVAAALGASEREVSSAAQVGRALAGLGAAVLVLDGLDRCQHAGTTLSAWRSQAPGVRLVVTARTVFATREERVLALGPLSAEDARSLFLQRARAVQPRLEPGADELDALERVLAALDRLPLALELCASKLAVLSISQLEARLLERWKLLATGSARVSPLRAALEHAWLLLDEHERSVLLQCSVFCGPFSLTAAERVVVLPEDAPWLPDVLHALRQRSWFLSESSAEREAAEPLFSLLESVRVYALERLGERAELAQEAFARHATWVLEVDEDERPAELLAVVDRGIAAGTRAERVRSAVLALAKIERYLVQRNAQGFFARVASLGLLVERHRASLDAATRGEMALLETLVAVSKAQWERALALVNDGLKHEEGEALAPSLACRFLLARSRVLNLLDEQPGALAALDLALERAKASRELVLRVRCHLALARTHWMSGGGEAVREHASQARELAFGMGNADLLAAAELLLGLACGDLGDPEASTKHYERAWRAAREGGNFLSELIALNNLGIRHLHDGQYDEAEQVLARARSRTRRLGYTAMDGNVEGNQGLLLHLRGDRAVARVRYESALKALAQVDDRRTTSLYRAFLATADAQEGRIEQAQQGFALARAGFGKDPGLAAAIDTLCCSIEQAQARAARMRGEEASAQRLESELSARLAETRARSGRYDNVRLALRLLGA